MKSSNSHRLHRIVQTLTASSALAVFPACASFFDLFKTKPSAVPVETVDSALGKIASIRAIEAHNRLYVAGSMRRHPGCHIPAPAHVDVQLIGKDGRVLAEKQDSIDPESPRHERARGGSHAYAASFPIEQARQAVKIRVTYHTEGHDS